MIKGGHSPESEYLRVSNEYIVSSCYICDASASSSKGCIKDHEVEQYSAKEQNDQIFFHINIYTLLRTSYIYATKTNICLTDGW